MHILHAVVGLVMLLCVPAQAGPLERSSSSLLITFPEISAEDAASTAARLPPTLKRHDEILSITDPSVVDPMRRELIPARVRLWTEPGRCGGSGLSLEMLIERASREAVLWRFAKVSALLEEAREVFTCTTDVPGPALLGRILFLDGLVRAHTKGDDGGFFAEAIAVAPGEPFADDYEPEIRERFTRAHAVSASRIRVPVVIESEDTAGLELRVDGLKLTSGLVELSEGRHFVQVVAPDGSGLAGSMLTIATDEVGQPLRLPPAELRPPPAGEVVDRLRTELGLEQLSPVMAEAARGWLRSTGSPWILLVLSDPDGRSPHVVRLGDDGSLETVQLEPMEPLPELRQERGGRRWRAVGFSIAGGLAAVAAVTGGYTGYVMHRTWQIYDQYGDTGGEIPDPIRDEFVTLKSRGTAARAIAIASGVGAAASLGITLYLPSVRRSGGELSLRLRPGALIPAQGQTAHLVIEGAW